MLKLIPLVGDAAEAVATAGMEKLAQPPAWHLEFEKLSEAIAKRKQRVLVVVDDVDRLDGEELRALLRVVRLLGRFQNVHYLMAYDQATIDGLLANAPAAGAGSEFMEKIVQYPFELPPVPMVARRRWARGILDVIAPISYELGDGEAERRDRLIVLLALGLETPRAASRLREQVLSLTGLLDVAEVDLLDFITVTWLRIAHHGVWDDVRLNKDHYLSWENADPEDDRASQLSEVEALVGARGRARPVLEAIKFLFEPNGPTNPSASARWRIRHRRYFDRYFQVGMADDDVSERKVEDAVSEIMSGVASGENVTYLRNVIIGDDAERTAFALQIASDARRNSVEGSDGVLQFVSEIRDMLDPEPPRFSITIPIADRWLSREIYLALKSKLFSARELVGRFGYQSVAASAYVVVRSPSADEVQVKSEYKEFLDDWV